MLTFYQKNIKEEFFRFFPKGLLNVIFHPVSKYDDHFLFNIHVLVSNFLSKNIKILFFAF
jgi:hypothetical protein